MKLDRKDFLKFTSIALLFLGLVIVWLGFGERGFIHLYRMDKKRQDYVQKIRDLERENQALLEEIHRLRSDGAYTESLARRELGLIKDKEILYRFMKEEKGKAGNSTDELQDNQH